MALGGATAGEGPTDQMETASSGSGGEAMHPVGSHGSMGGSGYAHMAHQFKVRG